MVAIVLKWFTIGFNCECLDHIPVGSGNFPMDSHEFLWFPMDRGMEKLKTHPFFHKPFQSTPLWHCCNGSRIGCWWFSLCFYGSGNRKIKDTPCVHTPFQSRRGGDDGGGGGDDDGDEGPRQSEAIFGWFSMYFNSFRDNYWLPIVWVRTSNI